MRFSNQPEPPQGRAAAFEQLADWALALPTTLAKGDGTGHSAAPAPCSQPSLPMAMSSSVGLAGAAAREVQTAAITPRTRNQKAARNKPMATERAIAAQKATAQIQVALNELRAYLHGGSYAFAIGPGRTRDGGTLMVSGQ